MGYEGRVAWIRELLSQKPTPSKNFKKAYLESEVEKCVKSIDLHSTRLAEQVEEETKQEEHVVKLRGLFRQLSTDSIYEEKSMMFDFPEFSRQTSLYKSAAG